MNSFWKEKRVLVTGGGGFLGSHVVEKLQETGCSRVFVVRRPEYDLTREDEVSRMFHDHPTDIVMHLAGLVGGIGANKSWPADFFYQNLMMADLTVILAWKNAVQKVYCAGVVFGITGADTFHLKEHIIHHSI